jgi:EmrB/QacA subfamily drug resistance transporter
MATAETTSAAPSGLTHRQILTIFAGLMMGMFLASLDQTIVSTAIRTIADDLNGYSMQAWVTTAYLITSTIVTPLYGKLSDMHGRKPFFMLAITIFIVGSFLCSTSTSMYELTAFRALQGLGAGGLMSLALTIVGDVVSPRERAKYQGYFLAVFATSSVLGPVLGGMFAGQDSIIGIAGWRWVFLVNVPIGIVALGVVFRVLNYNQIKSAKAKVDWWGAAALCVGVVPLLLVAEQGRTWGWGSGSAIVCYLVGLAGIAGFIAVEKWMGDAAIIPLRIFQNRVFSQGIVIAVVVGAVMFGGISMLPQYFQVIRGSSPTLAGLQMLPMVLGLMTASIASGQMISRTGRYKVFAVIGAATITVATFLFHYLSVDTALWQVMTLAFFVGFGLGNLMQPMTLALQNALPPKDMGVSTAAATFFRQIGGTAGVAVFFSVLFSLMGPNIADQMKQSAADPAFQRAVVQTAADTSNTKGSAFACGLLEQAQPGSPVCAGHAGASASIMDDTSVLNDVPKVLAHPFKAGFADSMDVVFLSVSVLGLIALVLVIFWQEVALRRQSGVQAQMTE